MKPAAIAWLIAALTAGLPFTGQAQDDHAASVPTKDTYGARTGLGSNSQTATGVTAAATPDPEGNTAEHDDTLYRGKTSDMENTMLREEGALHFKSHPKERVKEVNSLKDLRSTGTDPKFQGSFATEGVSSVNQVAEKGAAAELANQVAPENEPQDPRFAKRHLTFTPEGEEKSKKADADSSPSATPSPSASPAKKKSTDTKQ